MNPPIVSLTCDCDHTVVLHANQGNGPCLAPGCDCLKYEQLELVRKDFQEFTHPTHLRLVPSTLEQLAEVEKFAKHELPISAIPLTEGDEDHGS